GRIRSAVGVLHGDRERLGDSGGGRGGEAAHLQFVVHEYGSGSTRQGDTVDVLVGQRRADVVAVGVDVGIRHRAAAGALHELKVAPQVEGIGRAAGVHQPDAVLEIAAVNAVPQVTGHIARERRDGGSQSQLVLWVVLNAAAIIDVEIGLVALEQ